MAFPSIRGLAAKAARAIAEQVIAIGGAGPWSRWGGSGWGGRPIRTLAPGATHDWEQEAGNLWQNSIVALCLAWIGDRVARPKLKVCRIGRNGVPVEIPGHGLVELWTRPNEHYGRRTLEKAIVLSLKVDGNAYLWKRRDNAGRVMELWYIPHFRCRPLWPADGLEYISGYRISGDGRLWDVPKTEIIHIRDGVDPLNERFGLSALKAQLREAATDNGAASHTAGLMMNQGVPAYALVPDVPAGPAFQAGRGPSDAQANQIVGEWQDEFSRDGAGGVAVLQGPWKIEKVGYSPEELMVDKLPQQAIARLATATGVVLMSLGMPDPNKTYANLGEANRTSWGTIVATQELIAEALRDDLITEVIQIKGRITPASGPLALVVIYDYSQVAELQESQDAVMTRACLGFEKGLLTRNEGREMVGQDPVDDGDVFASDLAAAAAPEEPDDEEDPAAPEEGGGEKPGDDEPAAPAKKGWRWRY
ncbi:phage portal protein [Paludisphaera mucosa]|uniref:Phage portal protein n=1 Tax=Paludisphaera mucosa TaxID=3030827 RepID=A0ABT6F6M8_9BACT|nr:phage portal protein [Paludisphaera mucosa]MDG3003237.1 phage portal protein [Paludisphaera mucosa]